MMVYFLVTLHRQCYHILSSGIYDTIGCNYMLRPTPHYSGNYWWATPAYISKLPSLNPYTGKFDAEFWLLTSSTCTHAPVSHSLVIHESEVQHYIYPYWPHMYRSTTDTEGQNYDPSTTSRVDTKPIRKRVDIMYQLLNKDLLSYTPPATTEGHNYDLRLSQRLRVKQRLLSVKRRQNYDLSDDGQFISYSMCIGSASYADSSHGGCQYLCVIHTKES